MAVSDGKFKSGIALMVNEPDIKLGANVVAKRLPYS